MTTKKLTLSALEAGWGEPEVPSLDGRPEQTAGDGCEYILGLMLPCGLYWWVAS